MGALHQGVADISEIAVSDGEDQRSMFMGKILLSGRVYVGIDPSKIWSRGAPWPN
jgi:hypothetical protein